MSESGEQALRQAIATISQSDPIIKLLQQITLGRMKPADAGLRAITESWLGTYRKAVAAPGLTASALRRIDPAPRLAVLVEAGILAKDHQAIASLESAFAQALAQAPAD
jgi:hypothetical protein